MWRAGRAGWRWRVACFCIVLAATVTAGACGGDTPDSADAASSSSSGCTKTPTPGSRTVSLRHDGIDRTYDIVVPDTEPGEPMTVVLGFHGFTGSSQEQATMSGLGDVALTDGFVAVFP